MQIIPIKNLTFKLAFSNFFGFSDRNVDLKVHLSLPNAYTLMCFDRNINGNRDVKFWIGIIGHCTDQGDMK